MKPHTSPRARLLILALCLCLPALLAAAPRALQSSDFAMTIHGGSTLHDWESQVTRLEATGALNVEGGIVSAGPSFQVEIPVESIVSSHRRMDRLTYEALRAKEHPTIRYQLVSLAQDEEGNLQAVGNLTIAGQTRAIEMPVEIAPTAEAGLAVTGSAAFEMSEFGVTPPSLMMGTIKVRDPVRINFSVTLVETSTVK